jgi:nitroreductase
MEQTDLGLFEAIHTARALRRLKRDPIPEPLITRVLDAAIRAGSAGNAQNWIFIVVQDEGLRQGLAACLT